MKNKRVVLAVLGVIAALGFSAGTRVGAVPQPSLLEEKAEKEKGVAFKGKVNAVDASAKTLTVDGAVIAVADATKITKDGKEITLGDIKVGDQVHGKTHQNADGKSEALKIEVGGGEKEKK